MDLKDIVEVGKALGLQADELKVWAEEKYAREQEERAAERLATRDKAEREERVLQLRIRLAETAAAATTTEASEGHGSGRMNSAHLCPRKLIPPFDERRDDLDAYLKRFECIAGGEEWPEAKWATALSMCLTGEALKLYGRLSP